MADHRDAVVKEWAGWLAGRVSTATSRPPGTLERELRLLYDILTESVGPLRRSVAEVWHHAAEHYGRFGAARGLAAGEIVEEIQYLRELLIRRIGPVLTGLRQRQAMAIILRLSATLDKGIAVAVVGYTDALVATLFTQNGVPAPDSALDDHDIEKQLDQIETELQQVVRIR
ncbi:MAG TPA: hypothetical protein VMG41_06805 [Gemmatimonadales bacterium]|nr:hypothetical protein [Gemmatimonadales bacterium]